MMMAWTIMVAMRMAQVVKVWICFGSTDMSFNVGCRMREKRSHGSKGTKIFIHVLSF